MTTQDVLRDPDRYLGQQVQVSGEVEKFYSGEAFILSDHGLLVVFNDPTLPLLEEATAHVLGTVGRFDLSTAQAALGIDLPDQRLERFHGQPVIIAESIAIIH